MHDHRALATRHPILNWFINNSVTANLMMVAILLSGLYMVGFFGLFGMQVKIPLEAFPLTENNVVTIRASLNGTNPEDVESGVTNKVEESLQSIQGIEKITSTSSANTATIKVTAKLGYDMDRLLTDVKTNVDAISGLPAEVEKVLVSKNQRRHSILWVTLYGEASEMLLKQQANTLKDQLLLSPHVEAVTISGEKNAEIAIEIPESRLQEYNLSMTQIAKAINQASLDLSAGSLSTSQGNVSLRIKHQADSEQSYGDIVIRTLPDGSTLTLRDIASVKDGLNEQDIMSEFNGKPSLTLRLKSGESANVIAADTAATDIVHDFASTLPVNLKLEIWNNRVVHVRDRIDLFVRNAATGVLLVFLLLTLFLNLRLAFWVALGIPISFSGALLVMGVSGITINLITLFGFIIVLGIVVDDAIIIGESIYSWKKRTNNAPYATLQGTSRVSTAATFGVLTTVAAFLPLTQVAGRTGEILGQIGWVVIFCLLFSLLESKLILPAHLQHTTVAVHKTMTTSMWGKLQTSIAHGLEALIEKSYLPVLSVALRQRYFTLLAFIALFILAVGTVVSGVLKFYRFPHIESQSISLTVQMDNTVSVKTTQELARKAAEALRLSDQQLMHKHNSTEPNVTNIATFNTSDTSFTIGAGLASAETRTLGAQAIVKQWRTNVGRIAGAKSIKYSSRRRFSEADIEIHLLSDDYDAQMRAAESLMTTLRGFDGTKDIRTSEDEANKEIIINMKPEASIYGISETMLARTIRAAFYGVEAERVQRGTEEVKVIVRYPKSERESLANLHNVLVRNNSGDALPIGDIATLTFSQAPTSINHIDGHRAVTVYANVDRQFASSDDIVASLEAHTFAPLQQEYGITVRLGGDVEEGKKSDASMLFGFIMSLVMIYVLLAIPLKSYTKPVIIMSVIPFGIIGAIAGHLLLGMNLSMIGMFGIIALSGVVVNDSLLLLNTIQQHRDEGMSVVESITVTGVRRFRPIILTSITTFVGLMPILFETSFQAQFLVPMAVSLGFGILFATMITLILVPVLYYIFNDIKHLFYIRDNSSS